MPARTKLFASLAASLSTVMLSACGSGAPDTPPPLYDSAVVGGFELVDANGNRLTDEDFAGKFQMIYFGYAYCPDVCPFDVQRMVQGYNAFIADHPDMAGQIQPIFITVDPDRDTPEVVGEFTANFSEDLVGLTGTAEQIEAAAANYFAYYAKMEPNAQGGYLMDHSRSGYLVDREGRPMALLPVEQSGEAVAAELEKWVL